MARTNKQDAAKAKAARQKKIAIGGGVVLVLLLAIQVPKTMKMMNKKPKPPVTAPATATAATATATATATPGVAVDPNSLVAPSLGGVPTAATPAAASASASNLVAAVPLSVDPGQLETFERFASKDPFAAQVDETAATPGSSSGKAGAAKPPAKAPTLTPTPTTTTPAAGGSSAPAAPLSAVLSLNGELMSVPVKSDFPTSGATFSRSGALFHLISLTAKTAKIAVVGGSYADGAAAITLAVGKAVTLQNTADGTKYTLILEPQGTPVATTAPAATSTTPSSGVVPSTGSGG